MPHRGSTTEAKRRRVAPRKKNGQDSPGDLARIADALLLIRGPLRGGSAALDDLLRLDSVEAMCASLRVTREFFPGAAQGLARAALDAISSARAQWAPGSAGERLLLLGPGKDDLFSLLEAIAGAPGSAGVDHSEARRALVQLAVLGAAIEHAPYRPPQDVSAHLTDVDVMRLLDPALRQSRREI